MNMLMYSALSLLSTADTVLTGGAGGGDAAAAAATTTETAAASTGFMGGFGGTGLLLYAALLGGLYFFLIRPQRKREKEIRAMQDALTVGDQIVTSSGLFGTITAVGEDCFVVEFGTNKGVRIPIRKVDIIGKKAPNLTPGKEVKEVKDSKSSKAEKAAEATE